MSNKTEHFPTDITEESTRIRVREVPVPEVAPKLADPEEPVQRDHAHLSTGAKGGINSNTQTDEQG